MRAFILTFLVWMFSFWLIALQATANESEPVVTGKVTASIVSSHDSVAPGQEITAGEINWPLPRPIPTGPIVNYGFEGTPLFPVKFTISPEAEIGSEMTIVSNFYYLVCEETCIPEDGSASLSITIGEPASDPRWKAVIEAALAEGPRREDVQGAIKKSANSVDISFLNLPESANCDARCRWLNAFNDA